MKTDRIHRWDVTYQEAVALQEELRERLILTEDALREPPRWVAGADVSYERRSDLFHAAVILLRYADLTPIEEATVSARVLFPYIPGLLTFREGPPLLAAFERLHRRPDLVFFDGQGIAHPRGFGLAAHLGLLLDLPAIGCAKSLLVGSHGDVGEKRGSWTELLYRTRRVGAAVRTRDRVRHVYVSQGHRITLERAVALALGCCRGYRIPEPVRLAHLAVNRLRLEGHCGNGP